MFHRKQNDTIFYVLRGFSFLLPNGFKTCLEVEEKMHFLATRPVDELIGSVEHEIAYILGV